MSSTDLDLHDGYNCRERCFAKTTMVSISKRRGVSGLHICASPSWAIFVLSCVALLAVKSFNAVHIDEQDVVARNAMAAVSETINAESSWPNTSTAHVLVQGEHEETTIAERRKRRNEQFAPDAENNITALVESIPPSSFNFTKIVIEQKLARPFTFGLTHPEIPADRMQSWCMPHYSNQRSRHGLLFNKMPKAASSTVSGIALRIAQHYATRHYPNVTEDEATVIPCNSRVEHVLGNKAGETFGKRDRTGRSFLFSTLRDPAHRAMSRVYFTHVSQGNGSPTAENILNWLKTSTSAQHGTISRGKGGFQMAYLAFRSIDKRPFWAESDPYHVRNVELLYDVVREIMADYDLLMLVERFDECLVVMQLLLGLEANDILYLSSKVAGDYYYDKRKNKCFSLAKKESLPIIDQYLESVEWVAMSYGDYVLYEAVNRSLDLTIDSLGRERFEDALDAFVKLKNRAEEKCAAEAVFPCSSTGKKQLAESSESCYDRDWGCGYPCLDTLQAVE